MELEEINVSAYMECPVCLNVLFPPIYTCQNQHAVCPDCLPRIYHGTCPICRRDFRENCHRCRFREMIFRNSAIPCKYQDEGCKVRALGPEVRRHQNYCEFRSHEQEIAESLRTEIHYSESDARADYVHRRTLRRFLFGLVIVGVLTMVVATVLFCVFGKN